MPLFASFSALDLGGNTLLRTSMMYCTSILAQSLTADPKTLMQRLLSLSKDGPHPFRNGLREDSIA